MRLTEIVVFSTRLRKSAAVLGTLDQLISASSNVVLTVIIARSTSVEQFGAFSVVLILFSIILGVARALLGEPILTRDPIHTIHPWAVARTGGALGIVAGTSVAIVATLLPSLRPPLFALALVLPAVIAQDALRYWGFAMGRSGLMLVLDLVWLVVLLAGLCASVLGRWTPTVPLGILYWGAGALGSLCFGIALLAAMGRPHGGIFLRPLLLMRQSFPLGGQYVIQFLITYAASAAAFALAPAVMGLAAAGQLRAAFFAYSAVNVLVAASTTVGVTLLAKRAESPSLPLVVLAESVCLTSVVVANMVVLLVLSPSVGSSILGASFSGAQRLAVPVGLAVCVSAFGLGPASALRAAKRPRELTLARLSFAVTAPILSLGAVAVTGYGAAAFAYGWLASSLVGTAALWLAWGRSLSASEAVA
ncbi:MAG: hypothetical protein ACR2LG_06075 [Actinomycetota bacterium]